MICYQILVASWIASLKQFFVPADKLSFPKKKNNSKKKYSKKKTPYFKQRDLVHVFVNPEFPKFLYFLFPMGFFFLW